MAEEGLEYYKGNLCSRWSEDEMDDDSDDDEDPMALASKKLKTTNSPHVPRRSQKTWSTQPRPPKGSVTVWESVSV